MFSNLSRKDLETFLIERPDNDPRAAIAHILGTLDDKIELNRKMNETLEAIARAIFKSWFIDFDPVRANMENRSPQMPLPPGDDSNAGIASLFPDSFVDSELGEIPREWRVGTLERVAAINPRSIKKDYPYSTISYVDISAVSVGKLEGTTGYELDKAPSRAKKLAMHGDTIWSCVRPNRRSYLFIHQPAENLVISTGFVVLSPRLVTPSFLYTWVTTDQFVEYLSFNADGSAYPAVRPEHFAQAEILMPSESVLKAFEQTVSSLRDKIAGNELESRTLAAIRDALLPGLLSGKIVLEDANELLSELQSHDRIEYPYGENIDEWNATTTE